MGPQTVQYWEDGLILAGAGRVVHAKDTARPRLAAGMNVRGRGAFIDGVHMDEFAFGVAHLANAMGWKACARCKSKALVRSYLYLGEWAHLCMSCGWVITEVRITMDAATYHAVRLSDPGADDA